MTEPRWLIRFSDPITTKTVTEFRDAWDKSEHKETILLGPGVSLTDLRTGRTYGADPTLPDPTKVEPSGPRWLVLLAYGMIGGSLGSGAVLIVAAVIR